MQWSSVSQYKDSQIWFHHADSKLDHSAIYAAPLAEMYKQHEQRQKSLQYLMQPEGNPFRVVLRQVVFLHRGPAEGIHKGGLSPGERAWGEAADLGAWGHKQSY